MPIQITSDTNDEETALDRFFRSNTVEGVDFAGALERFGNAKALLGFLQSYAAHTPSTLEKIRSPNRETLSRYGITIHSLKGASYGIAAETAGRMAEELEKAAAAGNLELVLEKNDAVIAVVEKILTGLTELLSRAELLQEKPKKSEPDPAILKHIAEAAAEYRVGEIDKAMNELEKYRYESHSDLIVWLHDHINRSEFEMIQEKLSERLSG
jgi:HPt (histidine-containing phosphotransfer) domain-containing protein